MTPHLRSQYSKYSYRRERELGANAKFRRSDFYPQGYGGRLFLQQIMHFKSIVDGILLFVVRMALQKTFLKSF